MAQFLIGLDVGSTTVKALVSDADTREVVWRDYQRHETKQPEKVLEFLRRMQAEAGLTAGRDRIFMTGSGAGPLALLIGAKFVQEVTAVALAVEQLHPEVYSVVELGGQDAKIIVFKDDEQSGRKKKIPSMNDKCAGGTGAVIDKINAKLRIPPAELCDQGYHGIKLHKVAGKCGVFAETDINSLQKTGTPNDELMASLFEAIVLQNLSVLTRGNTLRPHVLLLGGPNSFIRGLREAWQANIPRIWQERKVEIPAGATPEDLIRVPENAQYYAALGAIAFGRDEEPEVGAYAGVEPLLDYLDRGRREEKRKSGGKALVGSPQELAEFRQRYQRAPFHQAAFPAGSVVRGFLGLDGGSTSTKVALLDEHRQVLAKVYQLSKGNPIQDTIEVLAELRRTVEAEGARLEVLGVGTTGYAKDILKDVLHADVALVETVAHTESAMLFYDDPHVIVDVGGQDIKLIVLKDGRVKDFKLNTQCSAGNGYFLQSTAEGFGIPIERYADTAFAADSMPIFGYGCAVFMQSDIVSFQRQGWRAEEILAGLAAVLPKNVFSTSPPSPTWRRWARASCCKGAPRTTSPRSNPRWTSSTPVSAARRRPRSSCTSTAASRAPSAPRSRRCGCGGGGGRRAFWGWRRWRASPTAPPAARPRAATSARTTAYALSLTCRQWRWRRRGNCSIPPRWPGAAPPAPRPPRAAPAASRARFRCARASSG